MSQENRTLTKNRIPRLFVTAASLLATAVILIACDGAQVTNPDTTPIDAETGVAGEAPQLDIAHSLPPGGTFRLRSGAISSSNGGSPFADDCVSGQVLVGIEGRGGAWMDALQPVCVDVDNSGNWVGTPATAGQMRGGGGGTAFSQICSQDSAVVGFKSGTYNNYVGSLSVECVQLASAKATIGSPTYLPKVGLGAANDRYGCSDGSVATGVYGRSGIYIDQFGLECFEAPNISGRWSNVIDWPLIAIHAVSTPEGRVMTYGTDQSGVQGAQFIYDTWDPEAGTGPDSHVTSANTLGVDSFCSAAMVLPDSGNIIMPGGDSRPQGVTNRGIADAPIFNTSTNTLSSAADMSSARWYPTATMLSSGEILLVGGIDGAGNHAVTPEIYNADTDQWRSLLGVNTSANSYWYPHHWVAEDGRVFGISQRNMYYIDPNGAGSLQFVGNLPSNGPYGNASSGVMYRPGKILKIGGGVGDGKGAMLVDITNGNPQTSWLPSLAQSRKYYAESLVMPDGNVLVMGGSQHDNDLNSAAYATEMFDPETQTWSQLASAQLARLYHSTAVLLKDGRVLLAGGGAPGPLLNTNAEIFSPPYLFDQTGSLATRPSVVIGPEYATHGQQITLTTAGGETVEKATLVKMSSVTHSFDMEQRFMELPLSFVGNKATVQLPGSPNLATPGYYYVFLFNQSGVPSEGHILKLDDVAAPDPAPEPPTDPDPVTDPEPPVVPVSDADNLIVNGGFEQGKSNWQDCSSPALATTSSDTSVGTGALKVVGGGCVYQEYNVEVGKNYQLSCDVKNNPLNYASFSNQMYDSAYNELDAVSLPIASSQYHTLQTVLQAPPGSNIGSVTLYAEGTSYFDACSVVEINSSDIPVDPPVNPTPVSSNLLVNGDFEANKSNWTDCASTSLTAIAENTDNGSQGIQVENAGCIYQEIQVSSGKQYDLSCQAISSGTVYSSLSFRITDSSYIELAAASLPVGGTTYSTYDLSLTSPGSAAVGAVTLYSEDTTMFDNCVVVEQ